MDKVIAILGPTASGKSALAMEAARRLGGEIISADSMQVYRDMNIGTAKVTQEEMEDIPHHLIDIQDYEDPWNVMLFQEKCRQAIEDIASRGKVPILCGGTGLYVKAALYDYVFDVEEQDPAVEKELEAMSNEQLVQFLQEHDPGALDKIHPNNRKRLIRAAAIAKSGRIKSEREDSQEHKPLYDVYFVGLTDDRNKEIERINQRVDQMFDQGLVNEVTELFSDPKTWELNSFQGIGYKEFRPYFEGKEDLETVKEKIKIHTRQYARRQMTWFRNQMPVHWYNRNQKEKILSDLEAWYE